MLEEYAQDNNDTLYISTTYSTANLVLIMVWVHKLQCMFEEYAKDNYMHVLTFTAASASETQFNMTCCKTDEQTNKLVDGLKIRTLMRPS